MKNWNRATLTLALCIALLPPLWAVLALWIMARLPIGPNAALFVTLCVMGALAVLLSAAVPKLISCPAWLCGWAIGLTILAPMGGELGTTPLQIAAAMLVGVWYVGVLLDAVHRTLRG